MGATVSGKKTVRVDRETYVELEAHAHARHLPVHTVIAELWDAEKRRLFWAEVNNAYLAMRADPATWQEEVALREELAGTLMDLLDNTGCC